MTIQHTTRLTINGFLSLSFVKRQQFDDILIDCLRARPEIVEKVDN